MRKGIIRIQIFAPRFRGCSPELSEREFALERGKDGEFRDRVFNEGYLDNLLKDYSDIEKKGDEYTRRYKCNGHDCFTKYIFKPL